MSSIAPSAGDSDPLKPVLGKPIFSGRYPGNAGSPHVPKMLTQLPEFIDIKGCEVWSAAITRPEKPRWSSDGLCGSGSTRRKVIERGTGGGGRAPLPLVLSHPGEERQGARREGGGEICGVDDVCRRVLVCGKET